MHLIKSCYCYITNGPFNLYIHTYILLDDLYRISILKRPEDSLRLGISIVKAIYCHSALQCSLAGCKVCQQYGQRGGLWPIYRIEEVMGLLFICIFIHTRCYPRLCPRCSPRLPAPTPAPAFNFIKH